MSIIKDHPIKILLGSAGSIIAIVTALFAVDARYAHAADVERDKALIQKSIESHSLSMRRYTLEDKLFELDIKKAQAPRQQLSPIDSALRERYQRQLNDISRKERSNQ